METPAFCIAKSCSSISSHLGFRWLLNINDAGSSYNLYPMVTMDSTICFEFLYCMQITGPFSKKPFGQNLKQEKKTLFRKE
jgi:hypothetical protein